MSIRETIRKRIMDCGADVCGFAETERFSDAPKGFSPADLFEDCKTVISVGIALPKGLFLAGSGLIYGHFNSDAARKVDEIVLSASKYIENEYGGICVPIPSDGPYEYWEEDTMTGKGLLSMKHAAVACGIGQIGKSSLLLNPQYGNRLILGALLTDMALESDPYCENICIPGCSKCLQACPVSAIRDESVDQLRCRQNAYGRNARGFDTVECRRCREVCPMRNGAQL